MAGPSRPGLPASRMNSMRPPTARSLQSLRAQAGTPSGRASPAESIASVATNATRARSPESRKRKDRDFDSRVDTNINVVVRCRGRNDREIRENSGVVVSTDGVKGHNVELSMGASALSNKTYSFDKVFSPAADQQMVFDEVVAPILDDVLNGFNCTIFAYGQTGTGKTYTMSGDITDTLPLPDAAGIVPRVLHTLFEKLESAECENSVKCSFIELYNEELRDLLAVDDNIKLKLYEDNSKKGHSATVVQGMEESHISNASKGIKLLREGSHKRQVAATKFYLKRATETGEDFVSAGKLNLVDLAGSENIQRSGAENKRAAEAGLINKSLLTLGRVINALVEKSSHIPYRESKLTRLLQDSLGGRTKTCIIATLSPAKSNLEETISTLDYAFRAKNIRNKPQVNQMVSKKTLFKEFTTEIEKLKMELIATRQRNGVYLAQETYEELTTESESRRILVQEQKDRIETMETNLRNKVQELFNLTNNLASLKKDNEATKSILDGTKSILEKTEVVLEHTRQNLSEEAALRKAHAKTEEELANIGQDLISTLGKTTSDIGGLHSKLRRRSDLHAANRQQWGSSQAQVASTTNMVDERISGFQSHQQELMAGLALRMQGFVQDELEKLGSEKEVNEQTAKSKEDLNEVLEEIKLLREDVKQKVGAELEAFHTQLHSSYAALGRDFKSTFDDLIKQLNEQHTEVDTLRKQMSEANFEILAANKAAHASVVSVVEEEKQKAVAEREELLAQMAALMKSTAAAQEQRLAKRIANVESYNKNMDGWVNRASDLVTGVVKSRENVKTKIKADFASANEHTDSLRQTTASVHDSTVKIVNSQMENMDSQLHSLDDIASYINIGEHFNTSFSRIQDVSSDMEAKTATLQATLPLLAEDGEIRGPLRALREDIEQQSLQDYAPTGETPQDSFLAKLRGKAPSSRSTTASPQKSPTKRMVFTDAAPPADEEHTTTSLPAPSARPTSAASDTSITGGLRELDPNTINPSAAAESASAPPTVALTIGSPTLAPVAPTLKRQFSDKTESKLPMKKKQTRMTVAGAQGVADRENLPQGQDFSKSVGIPGSGRKLRSQGGTAA
ncbi:Kinesin family protein [Lasiodiplodia theobromae]|uniref:Kinesin family protein n=1 Tax=Lasiodiplodia theobromae TaxID=45133 RepID=UPI0015C37956|nr:Kinesin family protein [Lasiodiplodia theobromae]KAF4541780.1 Kinesin family protein [Lasiodiplodia theobromae]